MKVLFLDIDGVMNNSSLLCSGAYKDDRQGIGDEFLDLLKEIVAKTGTEIVLSSSWRLNKLSLKAVNERLATRDLRLLSVTPSITPAKMSMSVPRADEILLWMENREIKKFAILDDDEDAGVNGLENNFFKTNFQEGLTGEITRRVIEHLGAL